MLDIIRDSIDVLLSGLSAPRDISSPVWLIWYLKGLFIGLLSRLDLVVILIT